MIRDRLVNFLYWVVGTFEEWQHRPKRNEITKREKGLDGSVHTYYTRHGEDRVRHKGPSGFYIDTPVGDTFFGDIVKYTPVED